MHFSNPYKILITLIVILVLVATFICLFPPNGKAEDDDFLYWYQMYVVCKPGDYVNIRTKPTTKKGECIGYVETGYCVTLDGKEKNGFVHCVDLALEQSDGWIFKGYLVDDEPINKNGEQFVVHANGRVACRKSINGKRRCWLKNNDIVTVWYWSREWCMTNKGFVQTKYLEGGSANGQ